MGGMSAVQLMAALRGRSVVLRLSPTGIQSAPVSDARHLREREQKLERYLEIATYI
jgi:hypothetical protein